MPERGGYYYNLHMRQHAQSASLTEERRVAAFLHLREIQHTRYTLQEAVLSENLWLWASEHLLSLKALHIPGLENRGANLIYRGNPTLPDS